MFINEIIADAVVQASKQMATRIKECKTPDEQDRAMEIVCDLRTIATGIKLGDFDEEESKALVNNLDEPERSIAIDILAGKGIIIYQPFDPFEGLGGEDLGAST